METPEGEDINSLFLNYDKDAILQLIEERKAAPLNLPEGETLGQVPQTPSSEITPTRFEVRFWLFERGYYPFQQHIIIIIIFMKIGPKKEKMRLPNRSKLCPLSETPVNKGF